MKICFTVYLIIIFFLFNNKLSAQTNMQSQIDTFQNIYQLCLDRSELMHDCAILFYKQMDSCLNVIYNQLRHTLNSTDKKKLKDEELIWIKERDKKFKSIDNGAFDFKDADTLKWDKKSKIVKERLNYLMKQL